MKLWVNNQRDKTWKSSIQRTRFEIISGIIVKASVIFIFFCFAHCCVFIPTYGQSDCELRKDQDSIKVYTCPSSNSNFKSIKASFTINTTFSRLASMILNIENYDRWQYNTVNPRILKTISDREVIYYVQIKAPWPVSDRDMICHLTISQDPVTKVVRIDASGKPNFLPPKEGFERVPMSKARWIVKSLGKNRLNVEYSIQIDPGGSVPAWMVNMVSAEAPYVSFKNFKNKIKDQKITCNFLQD